MEDSIIEKIKDEECWNNVLLSIEENPYASKKEIKSFQSFIKKKKYLTYYAAIKDDSFFSMAPHKLELAKPHSTKKRVVYAYRKDYRKIFQFLNYYLLEKYDYLFSKNLYSYRKKNTIISAIKRLQHIQNLKSYYSYKIDIHAYFNSIDQNKLLKVMEEKNIDSSFIDFSRKLFINKVKINHKVVDEYFGCIPGMSLSGFYANLYLSEMDEFFFDKHINYFRYADDIIIFSKNKDKLTEYRETLLAFLNDKGLTVNKDKENFYDHFDEIQFLGFTLLNNKIDISHDSVVKMKKNIQSYIKSKRKKIEKNKLTLDKALKLTINHFNIKFYGRKNNTISWLYWYLPMINTDVSLKVIDTYYEERLRYLLTGKNNKKNYKAVPYSYLKEHGFKPLVTVYYNRVEEMNKKED